MNRIGSRIVGLAGIALATSALAVAEVDRRFTTIAVPSLEPQRDARVGPVSRRSRSSNRQVQRAAAKRRNVIRNRKAHR